MLISYYENGTAIPRRPSAIIRALMGVNALFAGLILFAWTYVAFFVAEPLAWATWMPISRGYGLTGVMEYPFVMLWLFPLAGIFGQGLWVIGGSLTAFMIGQLLDVTIYHRIRRVTGERRIWLRATGSTLVSQFIDSFVVLYIAFVLGPQQWPVPLFLAVGTVNYAYKMTMAIALIPLLYVGRRLIRAYLTRPAAVGA